MIVGVGIVCLGFVLPSWFYFSAPSLKYEATNGGQKLLFDKYLKIRDSNERLEGILLQDYWTPDFFGWQIHAGKKLYIYPAPSIRER